ncbi:hypothetical protein KP509_12G081600 [Ceratopteris richardii]|uniref:Pentatricopeptide repeat-containing protein n=1 Tax=Ceratopteris richardii TaxID=49495 RepID=A0A8T2TKL1_CERRI|nr:hypothetical protein KP509_12G081600 [Ceratopteris richardii]
MLPSRVPGVMSRFFRLAWSVSQYHRGFAADSCIDMQESRSKENISKIHKSASRQKSMRKKSARTSSQDARYGISPKAVELVEKLLASPDVEIRQELDKWIISEGKFPVAYIKQAMQVFEREKNWNKLIQVSEWMLNREEGRTLRNYEAYLKALDMNKKVDQAELVWKNEILKSRWSIPTRLVSYALAMFERHQKPLEVIKLFTKMEDNGRSMDKKSIRRVARAYEQEGFLEMKKEMMLKYNIPLKSDSEISGAETS